MREQDEKSTVRHFRASQRYFCQDGSWWFSTREGEEGPFESKEHAEAGLQRYIDSVEMMKRLQAEKIDESKKDPEKRGDPKIWDRQIDSL